jgi:hypothetical protein
VTAGLDSPGRRGSRRGEQRAIGPVAPHTV